MMPSAISKRLGQSPSPGSHASPVRETSPTLAPDSTTQMSYDFDDTPEFRSILSELVGALGNPAANGNSGSPHNNTTSKYSN
jgi:hypothetical protein